MTAHMASREADAAVPLSGARSGPEEAASAPKVNTCTTMCLWEPDASLMIRKAKGQERARKSEYAAEERRGVRKEQAEEEGTSEQIREFEAMFAEELRACAETCQIVTDLPAADDKTEGHFAWWREQLVELHGHVTGAVSYLPSNFREKFGRQIAELETKLKEQRDRLTPKKKFGFKNRSKVKGAAAPAATASARDGSLDAPADGSVPVQVPAGPVQVGKDKFVALPHNSQCNGFRSGYRQTFVRGVGEDAAADFALDDLVECEVRLLSPSTGLWIRGLRHTTVVAVPLAGFVYISDCVNCTFVLGSRQLRIHTSSECDLYVLTASHPILEHCTCMRFAPYPRVPKGFAGIFDAASLNPTTNQWDQVDDFDWLKATASPNWSVLPEGERRVDFAKLSIFTLSTPTEEAPAEAASGADEPPVTVE